MKRKCFKVLQACLAIMLLMQVSVAAAEEQKGGSLSLSDLTTTDAISTIDAPVLQPEEEVIHNLSRSPEDLALNTSNTRALTRSIQLEDQSQVSSFSIHQASFASAVPSTVTTDTYSGVITNEGESSLLYPIYVDPGHALQVQLTPPGSAQLDYDLYLYEFDMATGDLITTPIDYSIYGTYLNAYSDGTKTLTEHVGTKNTTTGAKAYLIEVYAKQGASINDPFYVTVAKSASYDAFETDESAFHAYAITVATGGSSLNSRSINSTVDNDWYALTVPADRNYDAMNFSLDQTSASKGYKVEVYGVLAGNKMKLITSTGSNNIPLGTGTYYIRVYTTGQADDTNYTLAMRPVLRADKLMNVSYNSGGGSNDYPTYQYGRKFRIQKNWLTVQGVVATSDNYPVANAKVDLLWLNENWTEQSGNRTRTGSAYSDQNGQFTITLQLPPSTGSIAEYLPGPISFTHYYDLSGILVQVSDQPSASKTDVMYHFAYSVYGG